MGQRSLAGGQSLFCNKEGVVMTDRIGTQCYGLHREFDEDFHGTLAKIARIGYEAVEPFLMLQEEQGKTPKDRWSYALLREAKDQLDELGLSIPSAHIGAGFMSFTIPRGRITEGILRIHEISGIPNYVFSGMFSSPRGARKWGRLLHDIAEDVGPYGCTVVYHNHDDEWKKVRTEGREMRAIDCFYEYAGAEVLLELDMGWASFAWDELDAAVTYRDRIAEMHCRDFAGPAFSGKYRRVTMPKEMYVPVGSGQVRVKEVIGMRHEMPHFNGNLIVEQEKSVHSMLSDIEFSYQRIRSWLDEESTVQ